MWKPKRLFGARELFVCGDRPGCSWFRGRLMKRRACGQAEPEELMKPERRSVRGAVVVARSWFEEVRSSSCGAHGLLGTHGLARGMSSRHVRSSSSECWRRSWRFRRRVRVCRGDTCRQDTRCRRNPGKSPFFISFSFGFLCVCVCREASSAK